MRRPHLTRALSGLVALGVALPLAARSDESCGEPAPAALAVVDAYMDGFNARDADAHAGTLAEPSFRIDRDGGVATFPTRQAYAAIVREAFPSMPWHHTRYDAREVLQQGARKAHVRVRFTRYSEDETPLATHDSLYIVTCSGGRWGIVVRSSLVPIEGP